MTGALLEIERAGKVVEALGGLSSEQRLGVLWFVLEASYRAQAFDPAAVPAAIAEGSAERRKAFEEAVVESSPSDRTLAMATPPANPSSVAQDLSTPREQLVDGLQRMGFAATVADRAADVAIEEAGGIIDLRKLAGRALGHAKRIKEEKDAPTTTVDDLDVSSPRNIGFRKGGRRVLVVLAEKGPRSSHDIAEELGIADTAVRQRLRSLKEKAFVRLLGTHGSSRSTWEITAEGRVALSKRRQPAVAEESAA